MVNLIVNDINRSLPYGTTVLQACEEAGTPISRFCYHEQLMVAGNCRICIVEREGYPKPLVSCAIPASNGIKVYTGSPRVKKAREGVMERLLRNHPLDCPICDQGGECDLQDQSIAYGSDRSRSTENKRSVEDRDFGPLVKTVITRCIHCTRCVRFASEVVGRGDRGMTGRGLNSEIGRYVNKKQRNSYRSGNRVDLCPVGALTSKPLAFRARSWERLPLDTVDSLDANRTPVRRSIRGGEVIRVRPSERGWFIGDKTRYARDGLYSNRRIDTYMYGELSELNNGIQHLKQIRKGKSQSNTETIHVRRGNSVDLQRVTIRNELAQMGVRVLSTTSISQSSRYHASERGVIGESVPDVLANGDSVLRIGMNLENELPIRKTWIRGIRSLGPTSDRGSVYVQSGPGGFGTSTSTTSVKAIDRGSLPSQINRRRDGFHRRSHSITLRTMVGRVNSSFAKSKRGYERRFEKYKSLGETRGSPIHVLNTNLNEVGRQSINRHGWDPVNPESKESSSNQKSQLITVGVDDQERNENGRTCNIFHPITGIDLVSVRSTHAPFISTDRVDSNVELERRLPIQTSVESDQRLTNLEGKLVYTSGLNGGSFSLQSSDQTRVKKREDHSTPFDSYMNSNSINVFSDPFERTENHSSFIRSLSTNDVSKVDGRWNDRMLPERYDYYIEGHSINRASKMIAKCSVDQDTNNGSTTLGN